MNSRKQQNESPCGSLYSRLGGYDGIATIVAEFIKQLRADPQLARFGLGRSTDSQKRTQRLIVEQLCSLSGGPCLYFGRDMKTSHAGLGITESEWDTTIKLFSEAMQKSDIGRRDEAELLSILDRYKFDIVEAPQRRGDSLLE